MKTVKKVLVPAEEVEVVSFQCDIPGCDYETQDEDDLHEHHGKQHAAKKTQEVEGMTFHWFDHEDDAKAWLQVQEGGHDTTDLVHWSGPGWYHPESYESPCPKGCCTRWVLRLKPIYWVISDKNDSIRHHQRRVASLEADVKALEALAEEGEQDATVLEAST